MTGTEVEFMAWCPQGHRDYLVIRLLGQRDGEFTVSDCPRCALPRQYMRLAAIPQVAPPPEPSP